MIWYIGELRRSILMFGTPSRTFHCLKTRRLESFLLLKVSETFLPGTGSVGSGLIAGSRNN